MSEFKKGPETFLVLLTPDQIKMIEHLVLVDAKALADLIINEHSLYQLEPISKELEKYSKLIKALRGNYEC